MIYLSSIPLPRQWTQHVKSSFLQAVSLATAAFTATCALAANRKAELNRLKAELGRAYREIAFLKEEIAIKDERFRRVPSLRRPHYHPIQRLRVLQVKAARGWTIGQTADAFILNIQTVLSWTQRIDEEGERALIQLMNPSTGSLTSCDPSSVNSRRSFPAWGRRRLLRYWPGQVCTWGLRR